MFYNLPKTIKDNEEKPSASTPGTGPGKDKGDTKPGSSRREERNSAFAKRKRTFTVTLVSLIVLVMVAAQLSNFDFIAGIIAIPQAFVWSTYNLMPDYRTGDLLPYVITILAETALVSVAVTVTAAICAFFFSLFGSNALNPHFLVARFVRIVAAFFRNVPDIVWAIMLLFSFGQNVLTGFFALFFATFGFLTRTFIEMTDEVSASSVEALKATGSTPLQIVVQAIVPSTIAEIISWVLYMIETNIRASTLIGILVGTGIGALFNLYYTRLDYSAAGLVVMSIIVLVIAIEVVSSRIRKVIL